MTAGSGDETSRTDRSPWLARGTAVGLGLAAFAATTGLALWGEDRGVAAWSAAVAVTLGLVLVVVRPQRPDVVATGVVMIGVAAVLLGHRLLLVPNPVAEVPGTRGDPDSRTFLTGVDDALLAEGVPTRWRAFAAVVCLAAAAALLVADSRRPRGRTARRETTGRRARGRRWRRPPFVAGLAAAALATAMSWASAGPAVDWAAGRAAAHGADLDVHAEPLHDPDLLSAGADGSWTRRGLRRALAAGDVIVGVETRGARAHDEEADSSLAAVVGLRAADGAELWRYAVRGTDGQHSIKAVAVDTRAGVALVLVGDAVVGLDLDGGVRYTRPMPPAADHHRWWPVSGDPDHIPPSGMTLGAVAVFVSSALLDDEVIGIEVATGDVLWREAVPGTCHPAAVSPPAPVSEPTTPPPATVVVAMIGGSGDCATVTRYDGDERRWRTTLAPPLGLERAEAAAPMPNPLGVSAPADDRVLVEVRWSGDRSGDRDVEHRLVALDGEGAVVGDVDSNRDSDHVPGLPEGPPVAVAAPGGETFTALPVRDLASNGDGQDWSGWYVLGPDLSVAGTVPAAGPAGSGTAYGAVGGLAFEYRVAAGVITLRERTADLPVVDTVTLAGDERCPGGSVSLEGDDRTLLATCAVGGLAYTVAHPVVTR